MHCSQPRTYLVPEEQRATVPPSGLFHWLSAVFHTSDSVILQKLWPRRFFLYALSQYASESLCPPYFVDNSNPYSLELHSREEWVRWSPWIGYPQLGRCAVGTRRLLLDSLVYGIARDHICVLHDIRRVKGLCSYPTTVPCVASASPTRVCERNLGDRYSR